MIVINNVTKQFGNSIVLNNVSLRLPRTGLVVIQGPSGCGKTTLLNALAGLIDVKGDISVDNKHINLMDDKTKDEFRLKNYGLVFQDFKLFENETVLNNIMFPLEAISNASLETRRRKAYELIKLVGLKSTIKQIVNKLSGGKNKELL